MNTKFSKIRVWQFKFWTYYPYFLYGLRPNSCENLTQSEQRAYILLDCIGNTQFQLAISIPVLGITNITLLYSWHILLLEIILIYYIFSHQNASSLTAENFCIMLINVSLVSEA